MPLYALILLGFVVGKTTDLDVKSIATLMLYAVLPIVMFGATAKMEFTPDYLLAPFIIASISVMASSIAYVTSRAIWGQQDKRHNLLGMLGVSSNATYFGVPIGLAILGQDYLSVFMMMVLPLFIFDCTLGYYYGLRGELDIKESLVDVLKLPIIYGAIFGLLYNFAGFELSQIMYDYWERFTGTVVILGMMLIGSGLSQIDHFRFDRSFFIGVCGLRYILWPGFALLWVLLDVHVLQLLSDEIHTMIILIAACPLAANHVAYAVKLDLHPALTSCMILLTTLLALVFIPFMMWVKTIVI